MKTTSDIAAYVKRNGRIEIAYFDKGKDSKFYVISGTIIKSSKHLDDALENLNEEMRRIFSGTNFKGQTSEPSADKIRAQIPSWATNTSGAHRTAGQTNSTSTVKP